MATTSKSKPTSAPAKKAGAKPTAAAAKKEAAAKADADKPVPPVQDGLNDDTSNPDSKVEETQEQNDLGEQQARQSGPAVGNGTGHAKDNDRGVAGRNARKHRETAARDDAEDNDPELEDPNGERGAAGTSGGLIGIGDPVDGITSADDENEDPMGWRDTPGQVPLTKEEIEAGEQSIRDARAANPAGFVVQDTSTWDRAVGDITDRDGPHNQRGDQQASATVPDGVENSYLKSGDVS